MGISFFFFYCLMTTDLKALDDSGLSALFSKDRSVKTVMKVQVCIWHASQSSISEGRQDLHKYSEPLAAYFYHSSALSSSAIIALLSSAAWLPLITPIQLYCNRLPK